MDDKKGEEKVMRNKISALVYVSLLLCGSVVFAAGGVTYYSDPVKGNSGNPGSADKPWPALSEVVKSGKLKSLKGGDTLLLRSGVHGAVTFEGDNAEVVTVAAEKGQKPQLARLTLTKGSKWTIRGLIISPSFGTAYDKYIVSLGDGGASKEITLEDSFIYTTLDTSSWTEKDWMNANSGINMGRAGVNITLRNNYVLNTRFGISLCAPDSLCEGNIISDFSADGLRTTRDGQVVQYNIIKNEYVPQPVDPNHDDGIQSFLFNKGGGLVSNVTIRGNVIINQEDPAQKFPAPMQGLGFFDGPRENFLVEKNVVLVNHYHGISLYESNNCKIIDNAVYSIWASKMRPWIKMAGEKNNPDCVNTVSNNIAFSFMLDKSVKGENNTKVTAETFKKALNEALAAINSKFGELHETAGRKRMENMEIK